MTTSPIAQPARTTTRAAVIRSYGGPETLVAAEVPLPELGDAQVLVEVAAAAVNPVDISTREGDNIPEKDARFPMVLGWDVAGTVLATGASVTNLQIGDRVAGMVFQPIQQRGTYARYVDFDADLLAKVPDGLTLEQASTVPLVALTASGLLDEATVDGPMTLLVTGALGAVGRHVVALAARAGIEVIGAARAHRAEDLRALGAAVVVDRDDVTGAVRQRYPAGVDAAIDLVGGEPSHAAFGLVRDGGRYVTAVPPYVDGSGRFETGRGITPVVYQVAPDTHRLVGLLALAAQGILSTGVQYTYPLDDAAEAHRRQAAGGLTGRVLLLP